MIRLTLGTGLDDERPIIEYATPPANSRQGWRHWLRWVVAGLLGGLSGYLLSQSGFAFFCSAIVLGFVTSAVTAMVTPTRKIAFGLLTNGIAVLTMVMTAAIRYKELSAGDLPIIGIAVITIAVPGLLGAGLVEAMATATRSPDRWRAE